MDYRSVIDRITRESGRVSENDRMLASRAVESARRKYENRDLFFNRATGSVEVDKGTSVVVMEDVWTRTDQKKLPRDILKLKKMYFQGEPHRQLRPWDLEAIRDWSLTPGTPCVRGWQQKNLLIRPVPAQDEIFDFDYIQNLGLLQVGLTDEGKRQVYVNGEIVDEGYTDLWFTDGQDLIVNEALYRLWLGPWKSVENAGFANELRKEALKDLQGLGDREAEIPDATPWY